MPIQMVRNDITHMCVDAIVNAANRSLLGGGGVDGAIHAAAGPELLAECRTLGGCETGQAKITRGYRLPAKYVIHTVGPVWHGGGHGEAELLASCYRSSLELAAQAKCESVAFPLISTGAYSYPKEEALSIAVSEITRFLVSHEMTVYIVVFGRTALATGRKLFEDVREYIDDVYAGSHYRRNVEESRTRLWQADESAAMDYEMELADQSLPTAAADFAEAAPKPQQAVSRPKPDLDKLDWKKILRRTDEGFSQALLRLIDRKGLTDAECYKRANVDRKLFSKIRSNPAYKPSKTTAMAFCVALELSLPEAQSLLGKAGYTLTHASKQDIVVEYFLTHQLYDVIELNQVLFDFDLTPLGSGV